MSKSEEPFEPKNFTSENNLIYGIRKSHPGLLEIKIHNPKKKNATSLKILAKMG